MIHYINSKELESVSAIKQKYPNCKVLVTHLDLSDTTNTRGRAYLASTSTDSLDLLCDEQYEMQERGILAMIVGSYGS